MNWMDEGQGGDGRQPLLTCGLTSAAWPWLPKLAECSRVLGSECGGDYAVEIVKAKRCDVGKANGGERRVGMRDPKRILSDSVGGDDADV